MDQWTTGPLLYVHRNNRNNIQRIVDAHRLSTMRDACCLAWLSAARAAHRFDMSSTETVDYLRQNSTYESSAKQTVKQSLSLILCIDGTITARFMYVGCSCKLQVSAFDFNLLDFLSNTDAASKS